MAEAGTLVAFSVPTEQPPSTPYVAPAIELAIAKRGVLKGFDRSGRPVIEVPTSIELESLGQDPAFPGLLPEAVGAGDVVEPTEDLIVQTKTATSLAGMPDISAQVGCPSRNGRVQVVRAEGGFDATLLAQLKALPDLEILETERRFELLDRPPFDPRETPHWSLAHIRADTAWTRVQESTVPIAIIDTGIMDHPELIASLGPERDVITPDDDAETGNPHGTQVASIIAAAWNGTGIKGVMRQGRLMPIRAFVGKREHDEFGCAERDVPCTRVCKLVDAIAWAADNGARIINASWGQRGADSRVLRDAIAAVQHQILFVVSAGLEEVDLDRDREPYYPAAWGRELPNVLTVMQSTEAKTPYGAYGKDTVHVAAPGSRIVVTHGNSGYITASGTSFAVPFVSAAAALAWSLPEYAGYTPEAMRDLLVTKATRFRNADFAEKCRAEAILDIGFLGDPR